VARGGAAGRAEEEGGDGDGDDDEEVGFALGDEEDEQDDGGAAMRSAFYRVSLAPAAWAAESTAATGENVPPGGTDPLA
jgi:hypothetical protein